jgi:hypothetical protein
VKAFLLLVLHSFAFFQIAVGQCTFSNQTNTACSGDEVSLVAQPFVSGLQYTWTFTGASPSNAISGASSQTAAQSSFNQTLINATSAPATANYTVTVSGPSCNPTSFNIQLIVNPIPTVNSISPQTVCAGETTMPIVFSGPVAGTTFSSWINSSSDIGLQLSGAGNVPSFTATNAFSSPISGTISVTPLANNCFGNSTTVSTITVNPRPQPTVPGSFDICAGETSNQLSFSSVLSPVQFSWTNTQPSIGIPASGQGFIPSFVAVNNTNASIEANINVVAEAFGCTNLFPTGFIIRVHPRPSLSALPNQTICHGGELQEIQLQGPVQNTFVTEWSFSSPFTGSQQNGGGALVPAQEVFNFSEEPIVSTLSAVPIANGCTGQSQVITQITVSPQVTVSQLDNLTICAGEDIQIGPFQASSVNSEILWELSAAIPGLTPLNGTSTTINFTLNEAIATSGFSLLTVKAREAGCQFGEDMVTSISFHPRPQIELSGLSLPVLVCSNAAASMPNLNASLPGSNLSYIYSGESDLVQGSISGDYPPAIPFIFSNSSASISTDTLYVTASFLGCEGSPVSLPLAVQIIPSLSFDSPVLLCEGETFEEVQLLTNPSDCFGNWLNNNEETGLPGSSNELIIPQFIAQNPTDSVTQSVLSLLLSDQNGCMGEDTLSFSVLPADFEVNATFTIEQLDESNYLLALTDQSSQIPAQWYANGSLIGQGAQVVFSPVDNGEYLIESVISSTCSEDSTAQILNVDVSVQDLNFSGIRLFPNPCSEKISMRLPEDQAVLQLNIYDLSGKVPQYKHFMGKESSIEIDASLLHPGVYFVSIQTRKQIFTKRFLKL